VSKSDNVFQFPPIKWLREVCQEAREAADGRSVCRGCMMGLHSKCRGGPCTCKDGYAHSDEAKS